MANICEHHTCEVTKVARPMPMKARHAIQPLASVTKYMPRMGGHVIKRRKESARRGPSMSQRKPVTTRITMLVETAEMLPSPICDLTMLSEVFFFMYAISGAAAQSRGMARRVRRRAAVL